jgi:hypothetical protein
MLYANVAGSAQRRKTDSLKAYEFYHMGTHLLDVEYTEASNMKTQEYFRKAIERDPNFALAYGDLGGARCVPIGEAGVLIHRDA